MTIFLAANTPTPFGGVYTSSTSATYRKTDGFAPVAVGARADDDRFGWDLPTPVSEVWVHCVQYQVGAFSTSYHDDSIFRFENGSGGYVARLHATNNDGQLWLQDGATYDTGWTGPDDQLGTFDVHLKLHNTEGIFRVYYDGVLVLEYTGDTIRGADSTISRIEFGSITYLDTAYYSEIIIADEDTRDMRVFTASITADGATNTMASGGYADIDEEGQANRDDMVVSDTAGQIWLGALENGPVTGRTIRGVGVNAFVSRNSDTGPQSLALGLRSGATNYFGSNVALGYSFNRLTNFWDTDPNTATDWDAAGIDALQAGFRSAA